MPTEPQQNQNVEVLAGCPWCGSLPKHHDTHLDGYFVGCRNEKCPVQPELFAWPKESAFAAWNSRPSQPPQNVSAGDAVKGVVEEAIKELLRVMEMQEDRHNERLHINGETMMCIWNDAKAKARLALSATSSQGDDALKNQIEHLKDVLHRDQTGLAHALAEIVKTVDGYSWVTQGRGPYAWDDDQYRKEMGYMLDAVKKISADALTASGNLAHRECCGRGRFANATSSQGGKGTGEQKGEAGEQHVQNSVKMISWPTNESPKMIKAPVVCKRCNIVIHSPTTGTTLDRCDMCRGFLETVSDSVLSPAPAQTPPVSDEGEQVMPRVGGKPFRCDCGCNVFTKSQNRYKCNACGNVFEGEPAQTPGDERQAHADD